MASEIIDLISDSEPETVKKVTKRASAGGKTARIPEIQQASAYGGKRDDSSASAVKKALKPSGLEVKGKDKQMTEVEKIRELRLKRFCPPATSSNISGAQPAQVVAEAMDERGSTTENENHEKGKSLDSTTTKSPPRDHIEEFPTTLDDSYGVFDANDLLNLPVSPPVTLQALHGRKSTTFPSTEVKDLTQESDGEDLQDLPTLPKAQDKWKSNALRNRDIDTDLGAAISDPLSPLLVPRKPNSRSAAGKHPAAVVVDDDAVPGFHESHDKSRKSLTILSNIISSDPLDWDDIDAPEPKRRKVSNEAIQTDAALTKKTGGCRRTLSNIGASSKTLESGGSRSQRSKTLDLDPIVFTSSIEYKSKKAGKGKEKLADDDFMDIDDFPSVKKRKDENADNDFLDIDDFPSIKKTSALSPEGPAKRGTAGRSALRNSDIDSSGSDNSDLDLPPVSTLLKHKSTASTTRIRKTSITRISPPPRPKPKSKAADTALNTYDKEQRAEQKAHEQARKKAEKLAAQEEAKEKKRREKENNAKEKEVAQAFSKVNALKTDRKNSAPEMIVDFPIDMDKTLVDVTSVWLKELKVQTGTWTPPIPNVIKFRRKVQAEWDERTDCWRLVDHYIRKEKHVIVVVKGEEFIDLIDGDEGRDLACHALNVKARFENEHFGVPHRGDSVDQKYIIYLIEGLATFLKKNKNAKNRRYVAAVRNQIEADGREERGKKTRKADEIRDVDEEGVEDALVDLQMLYGVLVHQTETVAETAQWLSEFTEHVSSLPYRPLQAQTLNVCLDPGQIKSGATAEDTFIKMMQETPRLTGPVAFGIAAAYASAPQLLRAFEEAEAVGGLEHAQRLLEDLEKTNTAGGNFTRGRVGKAVSVRLWKVFRGEDEDALVK